MTKKEYNIKLAYKDNGNVVRDLGNHKFLHDINEPDYSEYFAKQYGYEYMEYYGIDTGELEVVVSEV